MTLIRFRTFGSSDWTLCQFEGENEELASSILAAALGENSSLHVQIAWDEGEWENVES